MNRCSSFSKAAHSIWKSGLMDGTSAMLIPVRCKCKLHGTFAWRRSAHSMAFDQHYPKTCFSRCFTFTPQAYHLGSVHIEHSDHFLYAGSTWIPSHCEFSAVSEELRVGTSICRGDGRTDDYNSKQQRHNTQEMLQL